MRNRSLYIVMGFLLALGLIGGRLWYVERFETVADSTADESPEPAGDEIPAAVEHVPSPPKLPPPAVQPEEKFENEVQRLVSLIGVALSKGDEEEVKSLRREVKWTNPKELMQLLGARGGKTHRGFGIGSAADKVVFDSIEGQFLRIERTLPPRGEWPALIQAAYRTAAVAEVMDYRYPGFLSPGFTRHLDYQVWGRETLELRRAALVLAETIEGEKIQLIAGAAEKVNYSCARCHSHFLGSSDLVFPEIEQKRRAAYIKGLANQPRLAAQFATRLILAIKADDGEIRDAAVKTLATLNRNPASRRLLNASLIKALDDPKAFIHNPVAASLFRGYYDWKPAFPEFAEVLRRQLSPRLFAEASPHFAKELRRQLPPECLRQIQQIDEAGNDPEAILKVLRNGLKDPDEAVRGLALDLLLARREFAAPAIAELCRCLEDADPIIRGRTALALTKLGKPAVLPLLAELKSTNRDARLSALTALGNIGAESAEATPMVLDLLKEKDPLVRLLAGLALKKIDPTAAAKAGVK